jgi:Rod binding domain-containing protein
MPAELSISAALPSIATAGVKASDCKKPEDAAKQFEALLIEQMLQSARAGGSGGWMNESEDESGSALSELAEQQFAQALAANGGIGLAKLVANSLSRASADQAAAQLDANR